MKSERLLSLDVLRGITIVGMILVNNPGSWGSIYIPLRHAEWNGLTPTDLVFPFFMFVMGVSMSFSLTKFEHQFSRSFFFKLVKRTVILFMLGIFLSWFSLICAGVENPLAHLRILGVLQRLAIAFFFGSILIVGIRRQVSLAWITAAILVIYYLFLIFGNGFNLSADNIIVIIDRTLFGESHIYLEWLQAGELQTGRVLRVEPLADVVTEEVLAKVVFDHIPDPMPPIGELAEVTITLPTLAETPVVPNAAIHHIDGKLGVWQVINGDLRFTPVSLGIADLEGLVQVQEGLKIGDQVVIYSENALNERRRIRIVDHIPGVTQ